MPVTEFGDWHSGTDSEDEEDWPPSWSPTPISFGWPDLPYEDNDLGWRASLLGMDWGHPSPGWADSMDLPGMDDLPQVDPWQADILDLEALADNPEAGASARFTMLAQGLTLLF